MDILRYVDLFFKICVLIICTKFLYISIKKLVNDNKAIQYYIYLLFYVFYIFPIVLQLCFPYHEYTAFWRANEAMNHPLPNIIYDIFVLVFSLTVMGSAKKAQYTYKFALSNNRLIISACTIIIIISFATTLSTSGCSAFSSFGATYLSRTVYINESVTGCGIIAFLILLAHKKNISTVHILCMIPLIIGLMWIVGKRYIVAETLIISIYTLSLVGVIKGKRFLRYLIFGGIAVILFCIIYGLVFKGNYISFVDYFMVDMSRQYTLVYQFYCANIGQRISVGRFDAIIWLLLWWIPRSIWPDKPLPFVNQLTFSLISSSNLPTGLNLGWATTCGIFSDLFDSFSFLGLGIGILLFVWLFKIVNGTRKIHYKILFMYLIVRLLTVQISSAIIQIIVIFIIIYICDKVGKNYYSCKLRYR